MFKYTVHIRKVSGSLNESVLPSKNLVIKSKSKKSNEQIFNEAFDYFKRNYNLEIESAEIIFEGFFNKIGNTIKGLFGGKNKNQQQSTSQETEQSQTGPINNEESQQDDAENDDFSNQTEDRVDSDTMNKVLLISALYATQSKIASARENGEHPNISEQMTMKTSQTINGEKYPFEICCYAVTDVWNGARDLSQEGTKLNVKLTTKSVTNRMISSEENPEIQKQMESLKKRIMKGGTIDVTQINIDQIGPFWRKFYAPVYIGNKRLGEIKLIVTKKDINKAKDVVDEEFGEIFDEVVKNFNLN